MTKPKQGALPIRRASQGDRPEWLRMRAALWPDETHAKHREEMDEYLRGKGAGAYGVARPSGGLGGFVEATIRPHADGCDTSPVGYVEGWYVDADVRRHGDGRRLIRTAERWARERGCTEMGSDCLLENEVSLRAHLAIGYEERERLIHFRRWLARLRGGPGRRQTSTAVSVSVTTLRGMLGPRARAPYTASDRSPAAGSGHT